MKTKDNKIDKDFSDLFSKTIDWEQRRYEIAKAALHEYTCPKEERYITDAEYAAIIAVGYADALIKELKKCN